MKLPTLIIAFRELFCRNRIPIDYNGIDVDFERFVVTLRESLEIIWRTAARLNLHADHPIICRNDTPSSRNWRWRQSSSQPPEKPVHWLNSVRVFDDSYRPVSQLAFGFKCSSNINNWNSSKDQLLVGGVGNFKKLLFFTNTVQTRGPSFCGKNNKTDSAGNATRKTRQQS